MSANVETMFYAGREVPWHGLGTQVDEAPTSADALRLAELDWIVESKPVYMESGIEIPNYKANVRSSDNSILGIVTDRYKIVQNQEAFDFTDSLIGGDVRYETAGSLAKGKRIWLLAKMPETKVLGEKFDPYICFTNSHDGMGAIRCCMTPIRVVCQNTLNLALDSAKRAWSTKHIGDISAKLDEARNTLQMADAYMKALDEKAYRLADVKLEDEQINNILEELFPVDEEKDTELKMKRAYDAREGIIVCYNMPDIAQFKNTGYGFINAVTDWAGHAAPARMTQNYQENNWGRILDGHPVVDKAYALLSAMVH